MPAITTLSGLPATLSGLDYAGLRASDGVTLLVEAALSAATGTYGAWDAGLWDAATWGPDDVWVDISPYLRSLNTSRRFGREVQTWEAGTATLVLDNNDGRFSPSNMDSPYVTAGVTGVRPWRPIRVRASYAGTLYPLWRGYALAWRESTLGGTRAGTGDATVTVPCADEYARLARFAGLTSTPVGAGETSGRRIHRLLDNAGHTGERRIDNGLVTMQATDLSANTADELKLTADSEGGAVYIGPDGAVVFEQQYALIENTRSNTVQATFGDDHTSELYYTDIELAYDGDLVRNIAAFARVGGMAQTAFDATSRALYGDLRESREDLVCESDAQVAGLAEFYVARFKDPERRVVSIEINPRFDPDNLYPQVFGREVRDRVAVIRRPPGGETITRDVFIAGIGHDAAPGKWLTTFELSSASAYTAFATSRWNAAVWDADLFFY